MKLIFITILFFCILLPCLSQTNKTIEFKKEISTWNNGEPSLFYNLTIQKVKQLNIDSLQSGYDSLQIRIWYDYSLSAIRKLLIIKRTNFIWNATLYTMEVDWDAINSRETIVSKNEEILNPKNGWNSFMKHLLVLQIMTLPDMNNIPGLKDDWTDGVIYNVEISTKKQYRFYSYHLPNKFQDKYWQAKNMVDILELVESEFKISSTGVTL